MNEDYVAFESTQQLGGETTGEGSSDAIAAFTTYAFQTNVRPSTWYECLQVLSSDEYTEEQITRLKSMFEASKEQMDQLK